MEMELGSGFGLTYRQEKSNDWQCLNNFLQCLQTSQGQQVYLGISDKEERKLPDEHKELILNWTEKGYQKPENNNNSHQNPWTKASFTPFQKKEWLDIGLKEADFDFAQWLRDTKKLTPLQVLNHENLTKLKEEYDDDR